MALDGILIEIHQPPLLILQPFNNVFSQNSDTGKLSFSKTQTRLIILFQNCNRKINSLNIILCQLEYNFCQTITTNVALSLFLSRPYIKCFSKIDGAFFITNIIFRLLEIIYQEHKIYMKKNTKMKV